MNKTIVFIALAFLAFSCKNSSNESANASTEDNMVVDSVNSSKEETRIILCFGNSLTAGYGLEMESSYPGVLQSVLDSLDYNYSVVNAGVSGETTAAGLNRVDWVLKQPVDVFILELGANDGLRGIATEETEKNLIAIVNKVREKSPDAEIILAGMKVPPSMGQAYGSQFEAIFPSVANKTNIHLIPFFLDGVAGDPTLNLDDGIHPNEKGAKIVVKNVMEKLKPLLVK